MPARTRVFVLFDFSEIAKHSTIYFLKISNRSPKITLVQKRAFTVSELGKKEACGVQNLSVTISYISFLFNV